MFLKTKVSVDEKSNVRFINGHVSFQKVIMNVYCFEVDGVLIDTGGHTLLKKFQPFFAQMDVDQIMITHFHEDHTGGAAYLQKEYGLPVYMNALTIDACAKKAAYPLYRQLFWGRRRPFQAQSIDDTFTSRNAAWDVIETPGHAKDHLAFLNRETGQLFSGDLYVTPKTKVILREEDIPTIIHSIERMLTYDFGELFCCHAGYVRDGHQALKNKLHNLKELREKILTLHKQGYSDREIQAEVFKKKYPITLFSFGEWDSIHIIRSILSEGYY
ncbi:MBL fold metallo-hydrolase [Virgibacillus siamensis]|uniref:MBL fold metallo-hydrolase n=1 Tax=Virgibacillus siamensis TaxID=480071 RepID=UPI0009879723|nr:MBL fold metallo-hydrolase [Virgibacillus siamensis]